MLFDTNRIGKISGTIHKIFVMNLNNTLIYLNIAIFKKLLLYEILVIIIIKFRQCQGNYRSSVAYRDNYPYIHA